MTSTTLSLVRSLFAEAAVTGATRVEGAVGTVLVVAATGNSITSRCKQLERVPCGDIVVGLTVLPGPTAVGIVLVFVLFPYRKN